VGKGCLLKDLGFLRPLEKKHSRGFLLLLAMLLWTLFAWNSPIKAQTILETGTLSFEDLISPQEARFLDRHLRSLQERLSSEHREFKSFSEAHGHQVRLEGDEHEHEKKKESLSRSQRLKRFVSSYREWPHRMKRFLEEWVNNYRLKRIYYRVFHYEFSADSNEAIRRSLKDLMTLFAISHSIEVSAGVVAVIASIYKGVGLEILIRNTAAALTISMPGTDPLCWIVIGAYAASYLPRVGGLFKPYKKLVRWIRTRSVSAAKRLLDVFSIQRTAVSELRSVFKNKGYTYESKGVAEKNSIRQFLIIPEKRPWKLFLNFRDDRNGTLSLMSFELIGFKDTVESESGTKILEELRHVLKGTRAPLSHAVVNSVRTYLEQTEVGERVSALEGLEREKSLLRGRFKPGAVNLSQSREFKGLSTIMSASRSTVVKSLRSMSSGFFSSRCVGAF
jgi:hypothetical protein